MRDPFLQVFESKELSGTSLLIDSVWAIYFRKFYALINRLVQILNTGKYFLFVEEQYTISILINRLTHYLTIAKVLKEWLEGVDSK